MCVPDLSDLSLGCDASVLHEEILLSRLVGVKGHEMQILMRSTSMPLLLCSAANPVDKAWQFKPVRFRGGALLEVTNLAKKVLGT